MLAKLWFILFLICCVHSGMIWDEECEDKECSGTPDRGDGVTVHDDWDGSTRSYSTQITYTCDEGLGFDTTGSPAKLSGYCGKKCSGFDWYGCFTSWSDNDPAECRSSDPEWRISGESSLPECNVGKKLWINFL